MMPDNFGLTFKFWSIIEQAFTITKKGNRRGDAEGLYNEANIVQYCMASNVARCWIKILSKQAKIIQHYPP